MTSRRTRQLTAVWVLAPLTAGLLSLSTDWALHHDPSADAATAQTSESPAVGRKLALLEYQVRVAAERLHSTRQTMLGVEHTVHVGAARVAAMEKANKTSVSIPPTGGGGAATGTTASPPSVPNPPVAPPPPVVNTTTGAS